MVKADKQLSEKIKKVATIKGVGIICYSPFFGLYWQQVKVFYMLQFDSDKTGNNFLASNAMKKLFSF